ncbi:MAG: RNA 2'-phosphotransferase [Phormidesmis sp.]
MSYVLRHKPESINIKLDENGWADVSVLLHACQTSGQEISMERLTEIVETNDKKGSHSRSSS